VVKLAKLALDVGLYTNQRDAMLEFWQSDAGVTFDELLPVGRGVHQLRHRIGDSILKINHAREALEDAPRSGYRHLRIATPQIEAPRALTDPDGNHVTLVPTGHEGIDQLELEVAVRDVHAHAHYYREVLGLASENDHRFRCGASLLKLVEDANANVDAPMQGRGYRYITVQVFDVVGEHRRILSLGGREGRAPVRLGEVAYISFALDPDGNWIEISQRKSITGSLDSPSVPRYT